MTAEDERYQAQKQDRRYAHTDLPFGESLEDTVERVLPFWQEHISSALKTKRCVLVSAHGNSLRALVKHLEALSEDEVLKLNLSNGVPRVYELDADLKPLSGQDLALS